MWNGQQLPPGTRLEFHEPDSRGTAVNSVAGNSCSFVPLRAGFVVSTLPSPDQNQHKTNTFLTPPGEVVAGSEGPAEVPSPEGLTEAVPFPQGHKTRSKPDHFQYRPPGGRLTLTLTPTLTCSQRFQRVSVHSFWHSFGTVFSKLMIKKRSCRSRSLNLSTRSTFKIAMRTLRLLRNPRGVTRGHLEPVLDYGCGPPSAEADRGVV
jgi:hypothetical protein